MSIISITNQCNQNCLFCSAKGRKDQLEKEFFKQIINQEKSGLVISGGEPTLSKDLFWVIRKAKDKKLFVELQTNGITCYYKKLAIDLINSGVDLFNINFPSHISSAHNQITQTKGLFNKKIIGIKNLQERRANFRLTCIVNSLNYKRLKNYVVFVNKNFPKVEYIQFSFIKIIGATGENPEILISYKKARPFLLEAFRKCQKFDIKFIIDHIPPCYLEEYKEHHIDYQKISRGEKPEYSLREKIKMIECERCSLSSYCCGVRKDYLKFFGQKTKVRPIK
ncbi:radical SAM protein [Patescibacteria group bacterium]|nr:radical SAM protein [Patescibacteria group bacterium]